MRNAAVLLVGLLLAGCGSTPEPADPPDPPTQPPVTVTVTETVTAAPSPTSPAPATVPPWTGGPRGLIALTRCTPADGPIVDVINAALTGAALTQSQMIAGPTGSNTIYVGGNITATDGVVLSHDDVWVHANDNGVTYALSGSARDLTGLPDGRDALGYSAGDELGTAIQECVPTP